MLIFIYGKNSYLSIKKLEAMRAKFLESLDPSGMNLVEFPVAGKSKLELGEVMQAIQTPPFLSKKRMVIIKGLMADKSTKADAAPWIESLKRIPESTIVILFEDVSIKKLVRHALFLEYQGLDNVHEYPFGDLSDVELSKWAGEYAKKIGLNIDPKILNRIVRMVGANLWQLSSELDKLSAYANGGQVTGEMVELMVRTNSEEKIFELMDAVSSGDPGYAIRCLENERNFGSPDGYLFAMFARQVRLLLSVRDILDREPRSSKQDVASEMNVHPFVAQKTMAQARNFSSESLIKLQDLMFELDCKLKRSAVTDKVAVDRVMIEMIGIA